MEGEPANLDALFEAGFRMIGLAHFFDNEYGGSAHGVEKGRLSPSSPTAASRGPATTSARSPTPTCAALRPEAAWSASGTGRSRSVAPSRGTWWTPSATWSIWWATTTSPSAPTTTARRRWDSIRAGSRRSDPAPGAGVVTSVSLFTRDGNPRALLVDWRAGLACTNRLPRASYPGAGRARRRWSRGRAECKRPCRTGTPGRESPESGGAPRPSRCSRRSGSPRQATQSPPSTRESRAAS
jgi:hypothetical protein